MKGDLVPEAEGGRRLQANSFSANLVLRSCGVVFRFWFACSSWRSFALGMYFSHSFALGSAFFEFFVPPVVFEGGGWSHRVHVQ